MAASLFRWWDESTSLYAAGRAGPDFKPTYIGVAFLAVLLIFCLVKAYRVWEEIHDVEEPSSPDDLLESFEQAHLAGELDDDEFERVRARLKLSQTGGNETSSGMGRGRTSEPEGPPAANNRLDGPETSASGEAGPEHLLKDEG